MAETYTSLDSPSMKIKLKTGRYAFVSGVLTLEKKEDIDFLNSLIAPESDWPCKRLIRRINRESAEKIAQAYKEKIKATAGPAHSGASISLNAINEAIQAEQEVEHTKAKAMAGIATSVKA